MEFSLEMHFVGAMAPALLVLIVFEARSPAGKLLMTQIELRIGKGSKARPALAYNVAGIRLITDVQADSLRPYALPDPASWSSESLEGSPGPISDGTITFAGKGWIDHRWREIVCRRTGTGYYLHISGLASFWIAEDGYRLILLEADPSQTDQMVSETALGAPFVLALALQGVFCLHVSVVRGSDGLVAFAGESGQGKSTLARHLGSESGLGWRRIIDDTLPIVLDDQGGVTALPHFPQLKLAQEDQPATLSPPRVPLRALYVLASESESQDKSVRIEQLTRREATLAIVQHTVGARLFDRHLLQRHLVFCDDMSAKVPVRRLTYPRRLDALPDVRSALESDLQLSKEAHLLDNAE